MQTRNWNIAIAFVFLAFSTFALAWWIPHDVESGVLLKERRSVVIGDAMAPTMIAISMFVISLMLMVSALFRRHSVEPDQSIDFAERKIGLSRTNLSSMGALLAMLVLSMTCMIWGGPLTVAFLQAAGSNVPDYRLLTDTVPYKYIGFAAGGIVLVFGLISWIVGRMSLYAFLTAVGATAFLIFVYDVPFDTLLLPPNGSQ